MKVTICEGSVAKVMPVTIFAIARVSTDTAIALAINEARILNRAIGIANTIEMTEIEKDIITDVEKDTMATICANAIANTATVVGTTIGIVIMIVIAITVVVETTIEIAITAVDVEITNGTVTTITAIGIVAKLAILLNNNNTIIPNNNKNRLPRFKCKKIRVVNKF